MGSKLNNVYREIKSNTQKLKLSDFSGIENKHDLIKNAVLNGKDLGKTIDKAISNIAREELNIKKSRQQYTSGQLESIYAKGRKKFNSLTVGELQASEKYYTNDASEITKRAYKRAKTNAESMEKTMSLLDQHYKTAGGIYNEKAVNQMTKNISSMHKRISDAVNIINNETAGYVDSYTRNLNADKLEAWGNKNTKFTKTSDGANYIRLVQAYREETNKAISEQYIREAKAMQSNAIANGKTGLSFWGEIARGGKQMAQFATTYGGIQQGINKIFESANEIKEIDNILTEVSKVSDTTEPELKQLGKESFNAAGNYGLQAHSYLTAVQEMNRSGYQGQAGKDMAELSLLTQSAGDVNESVANSYLLATNAAYKYQGQTEKLQKVLDGQNMVTNKYSVSMSDMAEATEKAASMAAEMRVKEDEFSASIGVIQAGTQAGGNEVGTSLKSLLINLQNVNSDKIVNTLDKAGASMTTFKNGVEVLRDPIEILRDLATTFSSLDEDDPLKSEILTNIGQKYHANKLSALLKGIGSGEFDAMMETYNAGSGSAAKEAEKSANNLTGTLNKMSNTFTSIIDNLVSSDSMKMAAGLGNLSLSGANWLTDKIGLWGTLGLGFGTKKLIGSGQPYRFILHECATGQFSREVYELCA